MLVVSNFHIGYSHLLWGIIQGNLSLPATLFWAKLLPVLTVALLFRIRISDNVLANNAYSDPYHG